MSLKSKHFKDNKLLNTQPVSHSSLLTSHSSSHQYSHKCSKNFKKYSGNIAKTSKNTLTSWCHKMFVEREATTYQTLYNNIGVLLAEMQNCNAWQIIPHLAKQIVLTRWRSSWQTMWNARLTSIQQGALRLEPQTFPTSLDVFHLTAETVENQN